MSNTTMKQPPGGNCHDLFGAEFKGSPCHHRVLKPPGGGSSDIFGASDAVEQTPRRVRNNQYLQSSVFMANGISEPPLTPRNKPGNDSHTRLFGPVDCRPQSTSKNRMKSNMPFGVVEAGCNPGQSVSNSTSSGAIQNGQQEILATPKASCNPVTGDGVSSPDCIIGRSKMKRDGNPVTGEGYTAANDSPSPPASTTTNGKGSAEIRRNRVPPGGYSSGLW